MFDPMTDTQASHARAQGLIANGFAAFGRESYAEAANYARAALAIAPNDPGALTLLGRLASASSRPDVALSIFQKLASPDAPPDIWLDLARAQLDLRREAEALESARNAVRLAPGLAAGWFLIGEIAAMLNDAPEAAAALRKVLQLAPDDTDAYPRLCRLGVATDDEAAWAERLLSNAAIRPAHAANLHYGLASVRKRQGRGKEFVQHLLAANRAQRAAFDGPLPDFKETNQRLVSIYNRAAFARAATASPRSPAPIFIVGMPRSGTTLVEQIVTGAPGVASAGELKFYRDVLPGEMEALTGRRFPEGFDELSAAQMDRLAAPLSQLLGVIANGAPFVTDKTLDNFQRIGLLLHMFPQCKIVCLRRDPMDVCFSMLQQQFAPAIVQTFDIGLMAQACRRFAGILDHWRALFGGRFIEVQYERLVSQPEREARALIEFCGLDWSAALLEFHERPGAVRTFSDQQVRKPIYGGSVGAWREFADELAPLRRALEANGVIYDR